MSPTTVPRPVLLVGLLVCAAALAACGGSSSSPAASAAASAAASVAAPSAAAPSEAPAAGSGNAVTIKDFAFGPASLSVPVGTTVTWTNADSATHTVTADDASFDSNNVAAGATFSQAFDAAGTFAYHCSIHPNMTGTIEVQ